MKGLWAHAKGGFFHDGRFATLADVIDHYDDFFHLGLGDDEKHDLAEYLKSLGDDVPAVVTDSRSLNAGAEAEDASDIPATLRMTTSPTPVARGGEVEIRFETGGGALPRDLAVALYDVAGRRVGSPVVAGAPSEGVERMTWNLQGPAGHAVQPGIYFLRATARSIGFTDQQRLVIR